MLRCIFSRSVHLRLRRETVAGAMVLLALVAVTSLLACGQYVVTEHTGTPDPDSRQLSGTGVPTATMAD